MDNNTTTAQINTELEQFVIFRLATELYGVSIHAVSTIIRLPQITRVPHTPSEVLGVMNLRGQIVPIIDLRLRFGLSIGEETAEVRIVVVENAGRQVGMLVDSVAKTQRTPATQIEPISELGLPVDVTFFDGMAKDGDSLVALLNLDRVLEPLQWDLSRQ